MSTTIKSSLGDTKAYHIVKRKTTTKAIEEKKDKDVI